jgi:hypothetical protein
MAAHATASASAAKSILRFMGVTLCPRSFARVPIRGIGAYPAGYAQYITPFA